jgi:hypothetical protein
MYEKGDVLILGYGWSRLLDEDTCLHRSLNEQQFLVRIENVTRNISGGENS